MSFTETALAGAFIIEPGKNHDERGFLSVVFNTADFEAQGLEGHFLQHNLSYNLKKGTLRGLHSQKAPYQESKIIRCIRGSIWDVIVDIRENSPTYCQWLGLELNAENRKMLYLPQGFLHGFLTLEDDTEVLYQVSDYFHPEAAYSARYDDPAFNIQWPIEPKVISQKDLSWPVFERVVVKTT
jgi:dTDP-4-dehydrorhamnose 3,5-epimerase